MDNNSWTTGAIIVVVLLLFMWYNYRNNRQVNCEADWCAPVSPITRAPMSNPMSAGDGDSMRNFGANELDRSGYLMKREGDYARYMNSALTEPNMVIENNGVDDRFSRPFLGSYVPSETEDYTNTRPALPDEFYATGLADDREYQPPTFMKNRSSVATDAEIDPFKDVIVDKPRDLESIDTMFSPSYLTYNKGQSYDIRPDIFPSINSKFLQSRNENDYDCVRGARLPDGRGPLMLNEPVRMYVN